MDNAELLTTIRDYTLQGHIDAEDEGIDGDLEGQPGVPDLAKQGIGQGISAQDLINTMTDAMEEVGRLFEAGEYLIPDMIASAECVGTTMDLLEPYLAEGEGHTKGRVVMVTVRDDLHDIGKNIVSTMLKGAGYQVNDIGINRDEDAIVQAVRDYEADVLGLSALLTSTMVNMTDVLTKLDAEGLRDRVKVIVGGAPITQEFADKIGADAYGGDAFDAIEKIDRLLGAA